MFRNRHIIKLDLHLDKLEEIGAGYESDDVVNNFPPSKLFEVFFTLLNREREEANAKLQTGHLEIRKKITTPSQPTLDAINRAYNETHMTDEAFNKFISNNKFLIDAGMMSYETSQEELFECSISLNKDLKSSKLELIKFIKEASGLGLKESKDLVDSASSRIEPVRFIKFHLSEDEIERFNSVIESRGIWSTDFYFDGHLVLRNKKLERLLND